MSQNEFFNILMDGLKDFPEMKLQDIISYYENSFTLGLASGKTEEEIASELGDPALIITKYRNEDLTTPINSEYITIDTDITPINDKDSINNSYSDNNKNFSNNDTIFIEDQNIVTQNGDNDIFCDFKTNDNFNNHTSSDNEKDSEINNAVNTSKASSSHEDINLDSNSNSFKNQSSKNTIPQFNINTILKICIVILATIIFFPVITGIIGFVIGLFGVAFSILVASIGVLIGGTFTNVIGFPNLPMFVANFPYPVLVLFSLASILLSIFLIILFYYLCKFFIKLSIKIYTSLKSKGGEF